MCLIIIDQTSKIAIIKNIYNSSITVINGMLNFTYAENTGGAFCIGNNSTIMFIIVSIIVIAIITKFIISKKDEVPINIQIALSLILAGGIGNLIDRVVRGFVIDFIDFSPLIRYPIFNIADIYIVLGCLMLGIIVIIDIVKERNK